MEGNHRSCRADGQEGRSSAAAGTATGPSRVPTVQYIRTTEDFTSHRSSLATLMQPVVGRSMARTSLSFSSNLTRPRVLTIGYKSFGPFLRMISVVDLHSSAAARGITSRLFLIVIFPAKYDCHQHGATACMSNEIIRATDEETVTLHNTLMSTSCSSWLGGGGWRRRRLRYDGVAGIRLRLLLCCSNPQPRHETRWKA